MEMRMTVAKKAIHDKLLLPLVIVGSLVNSKLHPLVVPGG